MDTEQIQQQMRVRRAQIDRQLGLLTTRARNTRRQLLVPAAAAVTAAAIVFVAWRVRRRRRARPQIRLVA